MPAGLEVSNTSGVKMVTQDFKNYHLIETGTFVIPAGGSYTFTRTGRTLPILAIRSTAFVGSSNQTLSGGSLSRTFSVPMGSGAVTVTFWLFDVLASSPANFGLEVYNAVGELTYASGSAPLRVVGAVNMTGFTTTGGTYAAGRTYASVQTFTGFSQLNEQVQFGPDLWLTKYLLGMSSWSSVTVNCRRNFTDTKIAEFDQDIPGFSWDDQPPRWIIVDVTDL